MDDFSTSIPLILFSTFVAFVVIFIISVIYCYCREKKEQTEVDMTSPLIYQANNPHNNGCNYQQYTNQQPNTFQTYEQGFNPYQYQYPQSSFNQAAPVVPYQYADFNQATPTVPYQQAYPLQNHQIDEPPFMPPPSMPDENSK